MSDSEVLMYIGKYRRYRFNKFGTSSFLDLSDHRVFYLMKYYGNITGSKIQSWLTWEKERLTIV